MLTSPSVFLPETTTRAADESPEILQMHGFYGDEQAMRELSGRLEEIPGEEAFPAYLESRIAAFYERAGRVRLRDGSTGSVTIGGTVSPAGGAPSRPCVAPQRKSARSGKNSDAVFSTASAATV